MADFDVKDLKALQAKCEQTVKSLSENNILAKIALSIERQAKINASGRPGPKVQTGRLRASIMTEVSPDGKEAYVGTNVQYAVPLEFGHVVLVGKGSRGGLTRNTRKMNPLSIGQRMVPAYPFLGPSVDQVMASGEAAGVLANFGTDLEKDWGL